MKSHLVSVALCTYNGGRYLNAQLDSILAQSYPNIEIIVVDDKSNDDTLDIIKSYQQNHSNIQVYSNEINLGFNKNFEKAISLCKGHYISISDQDDIWHTDKIEKLVQAIGSKWCIFSNSSFIDENGHSVGSQLIQHLGQLDDFHNIIMENFFTGHTCLFSREILPHILPIPQNGFYDWWIGFVALYHNKLYYLNEPLTDHRLHTDSVIQQKLKLRKSKARLAEVINQLEIFSAYKGLAELDKKLIVNLKQRLENTNRQSSNHLFFFLLKNYSRFFPKRIHKSFFSRIRFLRRFLKS